MEFKKYRKIYRLGKDETTGILEGTCVVQEKIDGANASIWREDGFICVGSRNNKLTKNVEKWEENNDNGFNGLLEYVKNHEGIKELLLLHPEYRLYFEWLVKHTVQYNEESYKHLYLFDVEIEDDFLDQDVVYKLADKYEIKTPHFFGLYHNPTEELLNEIAGSSVLGDKGEGVVIKNNKFINNFGDNSHAKIVTNEFTERNGIVFGNNNKDSETYHETYVVNKYMTLTRVKKVMQKMESEIGKLDFKDTPRVTNTSYHDMLTEEIWEIQKKTQVINFRTLKNLANRKAKQIFHDTLNNFTSVADE